MKNEMQVKSHVLDMLKDLIMGTDGGKFKPKAISVEVITPTKGGKDGLDEVLEDAAEANPVSEEQFEDSLLDKYADKVNSAKHGMSEADWEGSPGDEESDEEMREKPKMSLKNFLKSSKYSKGGAVEGTGLDEPGGFENIDPNTLEGDNYHVEKKPKMSLKEFLKSRK